MSMRDLGCISRETHAVDYDRTAWSQRTALDRDTIEQSIGTFDRRKAEFRENITCNVIERIPSKADVALTNRRTTFS
jgi:hypothetical protein